MDPSDRPDAHGDEAGATESMRMEASGGPSIATKPLHNTANNEESIRQSLHSSGTPATEAVPATNEQSEQKAYEAARSSALRQRFADFEAEQLAKNQERDSIDLLRTICKKIPKEMRHDATRSLGERLEEEMDEYEPHRVGAVAHHRAHLDLFGERRR